ncbi:MAG: glutaconyl-CoA/methylmalonyl-CoA decarboxylase subunit gamma [Bacteroidales bacterium]|jgi:biotin carboxyl carrier protein|nr:glutaconyl-CoA/methylmalonyl-CoA decarboxylase subunit gamma [Bacteroidales bacterium]MDN5328426.1 glutaconyl-CoA/methylmalonyl-CoA decarboxylase subunit gamma [Bacteroidales bacterium]
MKKFKFKIHGNQYEAEIINIEENIATIEINGTTYTVEVDKNLTPTKTPKLVRSVAVPTTDTHPATSKTSTPGTPKGAGFIKSPLPGTVLEVLVKEGDHVKIGQRVLLLEAMKMENNIDSDKEGRVVKIYKHKGDPVMESDILIEIGE